MLLESHSVHSDLLLFCGGMPSKKKVTFPTTQNVQCQTKLLYLYAKITQKAAFIKKQNETKHHTITRIRTFTARMTHTHIHIYVHVCSPLRALQ